MRIMRVLVAVVVVWLTVSASLVAQTPEVETGQAFTAIFSHDGANTTGYKLYLDNAEIADVPVSGLVDGEVSIPVPSGVGARGTHTLEASAYNADHEVKSGPLTFTAVDPPPSAPSLPRIEVTVTVTQREDGSLVLTAVRVEPEAPVQ